MPVASTGAAGTKQAADAGRLDRNGRHQTNLPSEICPTEPGVSGQRRLSVGGAITRFRCRSLEFSQARSNRHPQSGSRMRCHRWLQAERTADAGCDRSGRHRQCVEIRSGENFRDRRLEITGNEITADRVSWKSPDAPKFLPSPSIARWAQIPTEILFSLLQHLRRGEVAAKHF